MFELLLGHLVGDYLLQNDWMALNKKKKWLPLIIHCLIYSIVVCLFMIPYISSVGIWFLSLFYVFLSHVIFDGTEVVDNYAKLIGGRTWAKTLAKNDEIYTIFTCFVKVVMDNTFHLLLMWLWFTSI